ncbi:MAG: M56 family metallopeptidase [Algibacter sp.]
MEYLIKVSAILTIFYLSYKLFLQRDTFFEQNRWFLLLGLITSFLLPLFVIPIYIEYTPVEIQYIETAITIESTEAPFNILDYLPIIYIIGVLSFSIRFIIQLISLSAIIYKNKKEKHSLYTFIKVNKNTSPFSFFNWIVFNPSNFNETELDQIITHEKVHAYQKHSIDILLTQMTCIVLWFNPFIWLYNKSLKQNLEFIADQKTQSKFNCKKSYQTTLLKTSMPSHQMTLTNNFYTSLIKKRIVMLHKSKSKKINQLKYLLILPLLGLFLMSFNTEEVYVEKELQKENNTTLSDVNSKEIKIIFKKDLTDNDLEKIKSKLKKDKISFTYTNLERNEKKEIISLSTKFQLEKGYTTWNAHNIDNKPIKPFYFFKKEKNFGVSILNKVSSWKVSKGYNNSTDSLNITGKNGSGVTFKLKNSDNPLIIIDGKESEKSKLDDLNQSNVENVTVLKDDNAIRLYGEKGKNGVILITTKKQNKSQWKVSAEKNNVIYATKDTIHVNEKPNILKKLVNGYKKEPLYILDEKEITKKELDLLDEQTINSVSTIKGEHATTKFGKKGKNGVIIITSRIPGSRNSPFVKIVKAKLYIVDGKVVEQTAFESIHHENIKSINVLKGSAATTKYGDKGKNGVVEIITKNYNWETKFIIEKPMTTAKVIGYGKTSDSIKNIKIKIDKDKQPLTIVDGEELPYEKLESINPDNIKSIEVFKNKKNIKKYGRKGKNGVIIITTKKAFNTFISLNESKNPISFIGIEEGREPIYIINDKESSRAEALKIKSNDFKSITSLEGKEAIEKYGKKARDGAIEIITKK